MKQGSLSFVPETMGRIAVSAEYPVYIPRAEKVISGYLALILKSSVFLRLLDGMASGGATKTRIAPTLFEKTKIALPSLSSQRSIVEQWKCIQDQVSKARKAADEHESRLLSQILGQLGLKVVNQNGKPRCFALEWAQVDRWGVPGLCSRLHTLDLSKGQFPVVELDAVTRLIQYGSSVKANEQEQGTPVLRMNNVHNGVLRFAGIKHLELSPVERARLLLKDGDILFNRTNSKELVGKCAVFHGREDYIYASYLIRVRTDVALAHPDYVAAILNGPIGRQQIDGLSRQIIGQANINSRELRSLQLPLPPLKVQEKIVAEINAARAKIAKERAAAAELAARTTREVEEMILGHRPAPAK